MISDFNKVGPLHHLPLLELDDGSQLFGTDSIVKYLLPNEEPIELRDQVISFMSIRLLLKTFYSIPFPRISTVA